MAATQPNGWESAKWLRLIQMAETQPNGCDSAKWLRLSQMAATQPNGYDSAKWLRLSQMAVTQPNGCNSAKWLAKKKQVNEGKHNNTMYYLFIKRQRTFARQHFLYCLSLCLENVFSEKKMPWFSLKV